MGGKCGFCDIIGGNGKVHKIYEDKWVLAFLDKHPINPGHVLVIPKKHQANFYNLDEYTYSKVMLAVRNISKKISKKIKPKKVGLIIAGWDVPHTHVHIVPMKSYHDITSKSFLEGKRSSPSELKLSKIAMKLK